ncbi:ABC transporter ATP-binding protein [Amphibacillus cookii]|uniref:ABC transporter ATP-binding protein n=1 Tax=Amphibacillus cookii TaxID=767787 RepID=UPI001957AC1E|nr:ABC transporter ATP-binding protein [Amphibacillus cookii]MBM7542971.1 ABC-2 type transport system ATP-binding protein [Amphibacillus cookii]
MKIEAKHLNKKYKKEQALKNLTVTFEGAKIIGLLGKNGAGKTTFMRLLAGHFQQTKGELTVDDQVPFNHYPTTKNICLIQENYNFYEKFKIDDVLKLSSAFYPNWNQEEADHLLDIFNLKRKSKINALSKGMLSAVGIIVGLASHCPITVFDEPYIGLDASFRSTFYDLLLASYQDDPRLIILSTHLIDEVSQLFEEVAILHEGELLLHETVEDLANKHDIVSGPKQEVELFIKEKNVIHKSEILGKMTAVVYDEPKEDQTNLHYSKASLQDLFVYLTKEEVAKH